MHSPVKRLERLDGLRGLAACGVAFLYHPQSLFTASALAGAPRPLLWFQDWGWTMVDLFFLISGYVFAHVYLQGEGLTREKLGGFAVARVARLYPLHLAALLLCAALFWAVPANTLTAFAANMLMLQAFVQPVGHTFNGPSWSISVEVVCYVLFALGATGGRRTLRWVTALAIVGALAHFILQGRPGGPWVGDGLPRGLAGFFLGQVLWRMRGRLAGTPVLLLVCIFLFGLLLDMGGMSPLLPLCLCAWPALLLLALRAPWMGSAPMRWLGERSYTIYLVHAPLLMLVERWWVPADSGMAAVWAVTAGFAAAVLLLSDLCYRFFEMPARRAIRAAWDRYARIAAPRAA
ncbi:acyltransferase family protein [Novosphingobium beihaiensis]|uniref:Acyltransferase n=1 Tax=Novosphingobium beihaiensis TaxID=2930389 RepID=A0ABT0BSU4_9SPHN|nr:acyltransferase [Novosphingobium beihaiensis]MCJ2187861.1 acyltransferase [Novosphingobium beihaiensis]